MKKTNCVQGLVMITLFLITGCVRDRVYTQTNDDTGAQTDEYLVEQISESQINLSSADLEQQPDEGTSELDRQVSEFINSHRGSWQDANVPYADGQLLYDIIVQNNYKHAVELGTSTGHSAIWIAWALSKTGGKLITIELDEGRYNQAKANFKEAGVAEYIDARLGNAHDLVLELEGPVDFVFCDADKEWATNYFKALEPHFTDGACYAVHNTNQRGAREFLSYARTLPNYETTVDNRGSGMGITYKKGD